MSATNSLVVQSANSLINQSPGGYTAAASHDATVAGYVAVSMPRPVETPKQQSDAVDPNVANPIAVDPRIGTTVGNYYIKSVIASGGMGTVYQATQCEPVRRTVALKMIRRGMTDESTLGRFLAERQALAVMDHPDIAQVFEANTTADGSPYFAMEFCTGEPIDRYCRKNRLDLASRLSLVIRIARAVQQTHSRGVIHRDLKPANILVSPCEGGLSLKIIDFGIAKFTDAQWQGGDREATRIGELVGTPAYMSPEQASGIDVDARTDVFSMGAILFKLLTDTTPLLAKNQSAAADSHLSAVIEQLQSFVPTTPSCRLAKLANEKQRQLADDFGLISPVKLKRAIRGDLDWITLRAIESERTRRYATASDLADDLQRFLNHEPVTAVAPSRVYRAKKFYQRNRTPVLAAGTVLCAVLVSSVIGGIGWWNYEQERAEEQRRVAEEADILITDATASRLLATKGGPDAESNFIAAEASIAKAETILSGPNGVPRLKSLLVTSRREIVDDRAALRLVQRLENARERATNFLTIKDAKTFGPHAALAEISSALEDFGIQPGVTHPNDASAKLAHCPTTTHSKLLAALQFLIVHHATNRSVAEWANEVALLIDQNEWQSRVRNCILNGDVPALRRLAELPVPVDHSVSGSLVLADGLVAMKHASDAIDLLRTIQSVHPENFWANHQLGIALSNSGDRRLVEQGLRYLTAAVALRPQSLGARVNFAEVLLQSGDQFNAAKQLQVALTLMPGNQWIETRLKSLNLTNNE